MVPITANFFMKSPCLGNGHLYSKLDKSVFDSCKRYNLTKINIFALLFAKTPLLLSQNIYINFKVCDKINKILKQIVPQSRFFVEKIP